MHSRRDDAEREFSRSQTYADQNGNNGNRTTTMFTPGAGYNGSVAGGMQPILDPDNFGLPAWEINNEPIFSAELRTSIGNDSFWRATTRLQSAACSTVRTPTQRVLGV